MVTTKVGNNKKLYHESVIEDKNFQAPLFIATIVKYQLHTVGAQSQTQKRVSVKTSLPKISAPIFVAI